MTGLHAPGVIDALIDDVDAHCIAPIAPLTPPPLPAARPVHHLNTIAPNGRGVGSDTQRIGRARTSKRAVMFSAVLGFVAGAVCWHLVGFWWFISDVMFHRRGEPMAQISRPAAVALKAQSRRADGTGPAVAADMGRCTVAVRDGSTAETTTAPCAAIAARFYAARGLGRADFGDFGPSPVPTVISGPPPAASPAGTAAVGGWAARIDRLPSSRVAN